MARWSDDDEVHSPAGSTATREPPRGSVRIAGVYARLIELARERIANGDTDPRCLLNGSEDPGRYDPARRGNVKARSALAALNDGGDVTVTFWELMDATEQKVMPLFARGISLFNVGPDDFVWPDPKAERRRRPR